MAKCEGGYRGLFDLSGNVSEWEDSCESPSGSGDVCRIRGGSVDDFNQGLSCGSDYADPRSAVGGGLGFRCCAE
jgi:formylglycine-generating enzyme required for sulfatase activity